MTSKHTPGPWSVGNGSRVTGFTVKIATDELLVGGRGLTSEANARLIAAAPELLEALQRLVDVVDPESTGWNEAVAAIAKATGAENE